MKRLHWMGPSLLIVLGVALGASAVARGAAAAKVTASHSCVGRAHRIQGAWNVGCQGSCQTPPCRLVLVGMTPEGNHLKVCGCPNESPTVDFILVNGQSVLLCDLLSEWTPAGALVADPWCGVGCPPGPTCQVDDPQTPDSVKCVCR